MAASGLVWQMSFPPSTGNHFKELRDSEDSTFFFFNRKKTEIEDSENKKTGKKNTVNFFAGLFNVFSSFLKTQSQTEEEHFCWKRRNTA